MSKLEELDAYTHTVLHQFPRLERHLLCAEMRGAMNKMIRLTVVAWKRRQKAGALFDLDVEIEVFRGLIRKAHRMGYINTRRLEVRRALDRCLGTNEWQTSLYSLDPQMDFFNDPELRREPGPDDIEHFVTQRLQTIFPAVLKPLRLPKTGAPLFSLFFAVSNKAAINVASRIASHILSKA
jgi:hypothetical protein